MFRRLTLAIMILVGLSIALPAIPVLRTAFSPVIGVETAHAQEKKKRKTLFDILFKKRKKNKTTKKKAKIKAAKKPARIKSIKKVKRTKRKKTTKAKVRNISKRTTVKKQRSTSKKKRAQKRVKKITKPVVVITKNENASKILVVGDFLAGGMAGELTKLYASNANIVVIKKSNASSGLVRDDVVNWPETISAMIEEHKPSAIVTLLGMNDRQKLWSVQGSPDKLSEKWLEEYNNRITKITTAAFNSKIPLVWVGLPPVRSGKMNADYLIFNELYRTKVEANQGGEYVDIWNGFTNEEGKFVSAGPDINGQIVRLRGSKGINMTRAGRAKLAFFADKALQKIGISGGDKEFNYASFGTINPNIAQPNVPQYDPASSGKTVVIPLGSTALDGGKELEGEADALASTKSNESVSYDLVEKGQVSLPRVGRVDSSWGKPKPDAPIIQPVEVKKPKDGKKTSSLNLPNQIASPQASSKQIPSVSSN